MPICTILSVDHDADPVGDPHRLGEVVGDENGGLPEGANESDEFVLQRPADDWVERAERFVEQQGLRIGREGPARPTRCCIPPDSSDGKCCAQAESSTRSSHSLAIL